MNRFQIPEVILGFLVGIAVCATYAVIANDAGPSTWFWNISHELRVMDWLLVILAGLLWWLAYGLWRAHKKKIMTPTLEANFEQRLADAVSSVGRIFHIGGLRVYALTLALLLTGVALFIWGNRFQEWTPWVGTAASGFGAMLCAAAGLMPSEMRGRWLMIIAGGLFAGWVTWYTAFDQSNQIEDWHRRTEAANNRADAANVQAELANGRRELIKNDVARYISGLPVDDIDVVLKQAGALLANRFAEAMKAATDAKRAFRPADFGPSQDIISVILALNKNNGHALYFSGEIARLTGDPDRGQTQFFSYLETERTLVAESRAGGTETAACRTAKGYCRQRTAWINHLLANDIYQAANKRAMTADAAELARDFRRALSYACDAESLLKSGEFEQIRPTKDLIANLGARLGGQQCR